MSAPSTIARVAVGGVPVDAASRVDLAETFHADAADPPARPRLVFSMNGEGVYRYHREPDFRAAIDAADIVHADGMSVVRAGNRHTDAHFPERVATTDFFHDLAAACAAHGHSLYLVGGRADALERAVAAIRAAYPDAPIAGWHHGYFADGSAEEAALLADLRAKRPALVLVGLGRPRQELWCLRHRDALTGVAWLKTCGGLFDFLSGDARRAPAWMQQAGLEWLYRLAREPRRLFRRYLVTNLYSLYCYRFRR